MPSFRSGLPAPEVDAGLRESVRELRSAERNSVLWFAELLSRKLYTDLGYSSIRQYASERLGFSESKTWQFLRLARSMDELPRLRASVVRGEIPWTKAVEVSRVATPRTERRWIDEARECSRRELVAKVRRAKVRTRNGAALNNAGTARMDGLFAPRDREAAAALHQGATWRAARDGGVTAPGSRAGSSAGGACTHRRGIAAGETSVRGISPATDEKVATGDKPRTGDTASPGHPMAAEGLSAVPAEEPRDRRADELPAAPTEEPRDRRADELPAVPMEVRLRLHPEEYARYEALLERLRRSGHRRPVTQLVLAALEAMATGAGSVSDSGATESARGPVQAPSAKDVRAATHAKPRNGRKSPGASIDCSRLQSDNSKKSNALADSDRAVPPPVYQVYIRHCPECDRGWIETGGGPKLLDFASLRAILCDARVSQEGKANRSVIPPRLRRAVMDRDHHRCRVRGCGSRRFLTVHHLAPRAHGGSNRLDNLITLCAPCHRMLHRLRGAEPVLTGAEAQAGGRTGRSGG